MTDERPTPDPTPACEQDTATINYLHARLDRTDRTIERVRDYAERIAPRHPLIADHLLNALDGPQDAADTPNGHGHA